VLTNNKLIDKLLYYISSIFLLFILILEFIIKYLIGIIIFIFENINQSNWWSSFFLFYH